MNDLVHRNAMLPRRLAVILLVALGLMGLAIALAANGDEVLVCPSGAHCSMEGVWR